jgi:hypothetical protein
MSNTFEKEMVFESSVLPWIRIVSIRIHNLKKYLWSGVEKNTGSSIRIRNTDFINKKCLVYITAYPY